MKINIPDELQNMMPKKNGPAPNIDEETRQKQDEKKKRTATARWRSSES